MIAKAAWFNRRKYTGWGLTPKTWQGWAYVIVITGAIVLIQSLPLETTLKIILIGLWTGFILFDALEVMARIKLDEREEKIEAIAERNASWTMVATLLVSILYTTTIGAGWTGKDLVPVLIAPIMTGVVVKAISHYILDRKGV